MLHLNVVHSQKHQHPMIVMTLHIIQNNHKYYWVGGIMLNTLCLINDQVQTIETSFCKGPVPKSMGNQFLFELLSKKWYWSTRFDFTKYRTTVFLKVMRTCV